VDFLLTARRDLAAAQRFFERAIERHDVPDKITIDKSGANTVAVQSLVADTGLSIEPRQSKYLNNLVEQDHAPSSVDSDSCWDSERSTPQPRSHRQH